MASTVLQVTTHHVSVSMQTTCHHWQPFPGLHLCLEAPETTCILHGSVEVCCQGKPCWPGVAVAYGFSAFNCLDEFEWCSTFFMHCMHVERKSYDICCVHLQACGTMVAVSSLFRTRPFLAAGCFVSINQLESKVTRSYPLNLMQQPTGMSQACCSVYAGTKLTM